MSEQKTTEDILASPASAPEDMKLSELTILPDGHGFGILSLPLPKDHWLYAEHEYEEGAIEPKDLPAPILTHALHQQVIAAIRYAVRASTNCGKEEAFDPDAMVQNAVYALCGHYGSAAPTTPVSEDRKDAENSALKLAREALGEVQDLIGESHGVYGLHLNGDESPWGELEQGGRFERLTLLNEALAAIDEVLEGRE